MKKILATVHKLENYPNAIVKVVQLIQKQNIKKYGKSKKLMKKFIIHVPSEELYKSLQIGDKVYIDTLSRPISKRKTMILLANSI